MPKNMQLPVKVPTDDCKSANVTALSLP